MSELSLYKISLRSVASLLLKETWKHCSENPFTNLPSVIVDDVMKLLPYQSMHLTRPLLTSGTLTRLQFSTYDLQGENHLFLEVIRANCFKFLRFLEWYTQDDDFIPVIETLIRSCPKLEEFHSGRIINLDAFKNCKEFRVLQIYGLRGRDYKLPDLNFSVLTSLRNLQKVCFTDIINRDIIANILKHCPHVTSLGYTECLKGLEKIHANVTRKSETDYTDVCDQFQLKRCVWGENKKTLNRMEIDDVILYKSSFPEKIRIAVSLCPFVEELVIHVSHEYSMESLNNLKQLVCLQISFLECDSDCTTNFIDLLKVIGPQLKYLSVNSRHPVPVDIVCDCCPRLENFEIMKSATVRGSVKPQNNIYLKRLRIKKMDQNALLFLLSSCKALVDLSLCDALCLDDSLLYEILRLNPLAHLKICDIIKCGLSKRGFRMFLEKAVSLERVNFDGTFRRNTEYVVEKIIKKLNLTNVIYGEMFDIEFKELGSNF